MECCYQDNRSREETGGLFVVESGILESKSDWSGIRCTQKKEEWMIQG